MIKETNPQDEHKETPVDIDEEEFSREILHALKMLNKSHKITQDRIDGLAKYCQEQAGRINCWVDCLPSRRKNWLARGWVWLCRKMFH